MASGTYQALRDAFGKLNKTNQTMFGADFAGIELRAGPLGYGLTGYQRYIADIPLYNEEQAHAEQSAAYRHQLIKLQDQFPTAGITDIARMISRSASWVAEVLREAQKEREAEMNSFLVDHG